MRATRRIEYPTIDGSGSPATRLRTKGFVIRYPLSAKNRKTPDAPRNHRASPSHRAEMIGSGEPYSTTRKFNPCAWMSTTPSTANPRRMSRLPERDERSTSESCAAAPPAPPTMPEDVSGGGDGR